MTRLARPEDMPAVLALRYDVFVLGQGVPAEDERDELDDVAEHAVAERDGRVVGTGRLLPDGTIGRMAVAPAVRGQGIGAELLVRLEDRARERGLPSVELHAQLHARAFYDKAGYASYGEVYLEAGIDHVSMRKQLR